MPYITIDIEKIVHNAETVTRVCRQYGIEVAGVTKATCGMPQVGNAMLRGGVTAIGESRIQNILRMKAGGINAEFMLLRSPPLSAVDSVVRSVDISLNSELSVIVALAEAADKRGLVHDIILMVDLGDLREGIWPDNLMYVVQEVVKLRGVRIVGLGTNLSCYGGVVPTVENMSRLAEYADQIEVRFNRKLRYVSGGNTSSLDLVLEGGMPKRINHLRIGEGILLGRETIHRNPLPDTHQDAFLLHAEIIELKKKPSVPIGETGQDAFGKKPVFEDRGDMYRAILNVGREDVQVEGICPVDERLRILGASSDHLLVDVTQALADIHIGEDLAFHMNYGALLAAMTSAYVEKRPVSRRDRKHALQGVSLIEVPSRQGLPDPLEKIRSIMRQSLASLKLPVMQTDDWVPAPARLEMPVAPPSDVQDVEQVRTFFQTLLDRLFQAMSYGYIPIVISPDPFTSLCVYGGLSRFPDPLGVIVFSAFADFLNDFGPGGGCPQSGVHASAFGAGSARLAELTGFPQKLNPESFTMIGLREVHTDEMALIQRLSIEPFTMEDVDALGMREVCHKAIRIAARGTVGFHVTLDLSVLDPAIARGLERTSIGGISYREAHLAMEMIARSNLLRSVSVSGYNPEQDTDLSTARVVSSLALSLLGKKIFYRPDSR
jgi:predicted amino acid racemase/arginase family enzyme